MKSLYQQIITDLCDDSNFPGSPFELISRTACGRPARGHRAPDRCARRRCSRTLLRWTGLQDLTMANVIARPGRPAIVFAFNKTLWPRSSASSSEERNSNFCHYYDYYLSRPIKCSATRSSRRQRDQQPSSRDAPELSKSILSAATWSSWPPSAPSTASATPSYHRMVMTLPPTTGWASAR